MFQARRKQLQIGGAHIIFFKMTDLCNEQYSICTIKSLTFFRHICANYWGGTAPRAPPIPTALCLDRYVAVTMCCLGKKGHRSA